MRIIKKLTWFVFRPTLWGLRWRFRRLGKIALYSIDASREAKLMETALTLIVPSKSLTAQVESQEVGDLGPGSLFLYVGPGDRIGVYERQLFREGVRNRLAGPATPEWSCSPIVLWASFSAEWMSRGTRSDWLGFRSHIGCDLRGSWQKRWWQDAYITMASEVLGGGDAQATGERLRSVLRGRYDDLVKKYDGGKKYSLVSVLCARMYLESVDWGAEYWPKLSTVTNAEQKTSGFTAK